MAEATKLAAEPRKERGTGQARRMRKTGKLPAVIYGHKQEAIALTVDNEAIRSVIRHGVRVVDLQLGGKIEKCLIREVQWDAIGKEVVHVDFTRVSEDERVRVTVPVLTRGTSPGVIAGGVLDQPMHTLEIECLAVNMPDAIRVNLNDLQLEQAIHLKDVQLPPGVKAFGEPDAVVVQVVKPVEEAPAAAPAEAVEGLAEPEVIGRKVGEKEEAPEEKK
jgi:large subunit ribosomal protein L25